MALYIGSTKISDVNVTTMANAVLDEVTPLQSGGDCHNINGVETHIPSTEPVSLDVDFIDYDGRLLYSYSAADFLAFTSMPEQPVHTGLIGQGWNWTLAEAQTYVEKYGALVVGATYKTNDGATHLFVDMSTIWEFYQDVGICFVTSVKGGVTISWGDGETTVTTGNANVSYRYSHTYLEPKKYEIILTVTEGNISLGYNGANQGLVAADTVKGKFQAEALYEAWVGNNATILTQAFTQCLNLEKVMLGESSTIGPANNSGPLFGSVRPMIGLVFPRSANFNRIALFSDVYPATSAYKIRFISFSATMTQFDSKLSMFSLEKITLPPISNNPRDMSQTVRSLRALVVPGTYDTIGASYFTAYNYPNLDVRKLWIPSTVTSIATGAFRSYYGLYAIHIEAETPPTLGNSNAFTPQSWTKIYVPVGTVSDYESATNWSTWAGKYYEEGT